MHASGVVAENDDRRRVDPFAIDLMAFIRSFYQSHVFWSVGLFYTISYLSQGHVSRAGKTRRSYRLVGVRARLIGIRSCTIKEQIKSPLQQLVKGIVTGRDEIATKTI